MTRPLEGITVVSLEHAIAAPFCTRQLADLGARVIKIERPGVGDFARAYDARVKGQASHFVWTNRSKESLTLDLKNADAMAALRQLIAKADVLVQNLAPGAAARMGLSFEALNASHPRLIVCDISGYGEDGPYRKRPGFDQIAQGMGGMMSVTGMPGQGPVRAGIAIADSGTGVFAATGVLIALLERETSGKGQWVQSNLLQSMIHLCDFQAARYLIDGEIPEQAGNDHPFATPMGTYQASDGYFNIGASGTNQYRALCEVLGRLDLRDEPKYQQNPGRLADREYLNAELNKGFATQPTAHWVHALNDAGVPCGPIYNMAQVFEDPQVEQLQAAVPLKHPRRGDIRVVAQPFKLSRTPSAVSFTQRELGEDNEAILSQLGYSAEAIEQFKT